MLPYTLTNFEIQKYYQNELNFNGVYSINKIKISILTEIKNGTYIINLDRRKSIGTHQMALYVNGNNVIYFDTFGVGYIPK